MSCTGAAAGGGGSAASGASLPKSTSSAMPDPSAASVPALRARVHQRLLASDGAAAMRLPLSALRFRRLRQEDLDELIALHVEWFPLSYDEGFYQSAVRGEIHAIVATYTWPASSGSGPGSSGEAAGAAHEDILGVITMSTFCEHHSEDIVHILGADCATLCREHEKGDSPGGERYDAVPCKAGRLAYILTLGVADGFRRRGLAKELLRRLISDVDATMPHISAVYLHVVTYNKAAIQLYESTRFNCLAHFPEFYLLHGRRYDSYLYALYLHGSRPSWRWRLRHLFGVGVERTWGEWALSTMSSIWTRPCIIRTTQDEDAV